MHDVVFVLPVPLHQLLKLLTLLLNLALVVLPLYFEHFLKFGFDLVVIDGLADQSLEVYISLHFLAEQLHFDCYSYLAILWVEEEPEIRALLLLNLSKYCLQGNRANQFQD